MWSKVYWEMIEPVVKIRTLRARLASIQLSLIEFNLTYAQICKISLIPHVLEFMNVENICKHSKNEFQYDVYVL